MMPWEEVTKMSSKQEFVRFALESMHSFSELCRRFKISRKTGYKLIKRFKEQGELGLIEKSRRPHYSPDKTEKALEEKILSIRKWKPAWGGRKIRAYLLNKNVRQVPAASPITDILRRHNLIQVDELKKLLSPIRFEHEAPNDLWQADFKGHFAMRKGRCHPLTVLDDHSRYSICLQACDNERADTVKAHFIQLFEEYGLPWRINFDNGTPWGTPHQRIYRCTEFSTWLVRLGIRVSFSRVRHPQTNGKEERFHRTLKAELLNYHTFWDLQEAQKYFDSWRADYNFERPHEALNDKPPASRYSISKRKFPHVLPEIEYRKTDIVKRVNSGGIVRYKNKIIFISESLNGMPVALREQSDGKFDVYFCHQKILNIDMRES